VASDKRRQLGRYHIEAELGRGAMGVVYKAHDPMLDRTVALKTIALDEAAHDRDEYQARFFQEAKAVARLNHPAVITIYDFGEEDALAYMAMELLGGRELSARLAEGAPPIREAVAIAEQVAEGLAFAHDSGVIHRDIKPGNIMLLPRGRVKIMDFGIARLKLSDVATQVGTRLGTPRYMSPEQVAGGALDHRTDIFSLGIVLYEMLAGARLFHGDDLTHVMHSVATFEPPPPSRINPQVTPLLDLVVKRALEKKPADRYASAWEMVDDLRHCLQELASSPPPPGDSERPVSAGAPDEPIGDKTVVLKAPTDGTLMVRRLNAQADTQSRLARLALARRFDSAEGLARLQTPAARDRLLLARVPRPPGLLRRLRHDHDLAWLTLTIGAVMLLAAALALS
jgi:serine/threonine-protein kinase